ncbi:MAG: HAD family hydrolase [Streptosporangiaceae bacterium]
MTVRAVIFDWGGTLTPWHTIDHADLWLGVCGLHYPQGQHAELAGAIVAAERELWLAAEQEHRSATIFQVLERAGVPPSEEFLASYLRAWEPHTLTDPEAAAVLAHLRERGIRVGVLSNTMWPRSWHEDVFRRDGVLDLIDGAVYSSEIAATKPHADAFSAAMAAVGVTEPASCVFVGDRPFDDVHGAKSAGMRAVLINNSEVPAYPDAVPDAVISRLSELPALLETW